MRLPVHTLDKCNFNIPSSIYKLNRVQVSLIISISLNKIPFNKPFVSVRKFLHWNANNYKRGDGTTKQCHQWLEKYNHEDGPFNPLLYRTWNECNASWYSIWGRNYHHLYFVSTANYIAKGYSFVDIREDALNIDEKLIDVQLLINQSHCCCSLCRGCREMDQILNIAKDTIYL